VSLQDKAGCLHDLLRGLPDFVIAFSGGVDSGLLAAAAVRAGITPVKLITVRPPWVPEREYRDAAAAADALGAEWRCIPMAFSRELRRNPADRCYRCKKRILQILKKTALQSDVQILLDGSNADDSKTHRPGKKALREFGVRSPLEECGFTKTDVRKLAKEYGLAVWDKPAYSCLLTRIPHGEKVDEQMLSMIEKGEDFLIKEGFPAIRLRSHGDLARIEVPPEERELFCTASRMNRVSYRLKGLGYRYVSLDLEGYRCGKMDRTETE
jgi:pyridinium-3,5-biscarboxylic acid mononucleotide sulfurtransferase